MRGGRSCFTAGPGRGEGKRREERRKEGKVNVPTNVGNGWAPLYLVGFVKPISSVYKL